MTKPKEQVQELINLVGNTLGWYYHDTQCIAITRNLSLGKKTQHLNIISCLTHESWITQNKKAEKQIESDPLGKTRHLPN